MNTNQLDSLISRYQNKSTEERVEILFSEYSTDDILITSSFSPYSPYLLSLISKYSNSSPIWFIDTGFHFDETLEYVSSISEYFKLKVKYIRPEPSDNSLARENRLWETDPDRCCLLNKIKPIVRLCSDYRIWVSGLMQWQTEHRSRLKLFECREKILRFYPILDVTRKDIDKFLENSSIPNHPLMSRGFDSIGCKHCTTGGRGRKGRWVDFPKSECGIHL